MDYENTVDFLGLLIKEKGTKIISLLRILVIAVIFAKINYNGNINEFGM